MGGILLTNGCASYSAQSLAWPTQRRRAPARPVYGIMLADRLKTLCFVSGTKVSTKLGEVAIENLSLGDLVLTRDNGYKPVRWTGCFTHRPDQSQDDKQSVRIRAGALGNGLPLSDLLVSPQQRILLISPIAQQRFGEHEVLIAAKHLIDIPGVEMTTGNNLIEYWYLLLKGHQIVWANGAPTETFCAAPEALESLPDRSCREISAIFKTLATCEDPDLSATVRLVVTCQAARGFAEQMARANHSLAH